MGWGMLNSDSIDLRTLHCIHSATEFHAETLSTLGLPCAVTRGGVHSRCSRGVDLDGAADAMKPGTCIRFIGHCDEVGPVPPVGAVLLVVGTCESTGGIIAKLGEREEHLVWPEEVAEVARDKAGRFLPWRSR